MMFTDKEVLEDLQPSNWVKITPSKPVEPAPREQSHSRIHRAHASGVFSTAYGEGWPKALTTAQMASKPAATPQLVELKQEDSNHQQPSPLPWFAEIAQSL